MLHEPSLEGFFIGTEKPKRDLCLQFNSTGRGLPDVNLPPKKGNVMAFTATLPTDKV